MQELKKRELRKEYSRKRMALSEGQQRRLSEQIGRHFLKIDLSGTVYLHTFLPIKNKHEVDTWHIIKGVKARYPGIRLVVPKVDMKTGTLEHYLLHEQVELLSSAWEIPEPVSGEKVAPARLDMVLVPLLAYDKQGYRVGYGKGFYDRFLPACRPDVILTGLSYFGPVERITDLGEHDVRLHQCITPEGVVRF